MPGLGLLLQLGCNARCQVFDVTKYGAVGDGITSDTAAIRRAAAALATGGTGGTLLFPAGKRYLTGAFNLSSHSVPKLETGAVIRGSGNASEYPLLNLFEIWPWFGPTRQLPGCGEAARFMHNPFVFAWNQENISILADDGGTLDGNGWPWWACGSNYSLPPCNCQGRPQNLFFSNVSGVQIHGTVGRKREPLSYPPRICSRPLMDCAPPPIPIPRSTPSVTA